MSAGSVCKIDGDCEGGGICFKELCICSPWYGWTGAECDKLGTESVNLLGYAGLNLAIAFVGCMIAYYSLVRFMLYVGFRNAQATFSTTLVFHTLSHFMSVLLALLEIFTTLTPRFFVPYKPGGEKEGNFHLGEAGLIIVQGITLVVGTSTLSLYWLEIPKISRKLTSNGFPNLLSNYRKFVITYCIMVFPISISCYLLIPRINNFVFSLLGFFQAIWLSWGLFYVMPKLLPEASEPVNERYDKLLYNIRYTCRQFIVMYILLMAVSSALAYYSFAVDYRTNGQSAKILWYLEAYLSVFIAWMGIAYLHPIVNHLVDKYAALDDLGLAPHKIPRVSALEIKPYANLGGQPLLA